MSESRYENQTAEIMAGLLKVSAGELAQKEDLQRIITQALENDKLDVLKEIAFTSKYLHGLMSIVKRGDSSAENGMLEKYIKEYSEKVGGLREKYAILLNSAGEFYKNIFFSKYFNLTQEAASNLSQLCGDMNKLKIYFNESKFK